MSSNMEHAAPKKMAVEVMYSKPGTEPPIYLAGSFCNWQPQEMSHNMDEQGEYAFFKEVEVEEGKDYQYKFRVGEGDWWLLNEDKPSVTDDIGNRNNLLTVPIRQTTKIKTEKDCSIAMAATDSALENTENLKAEHGHIALRSNVRTPDIASSAAEVADSAMTLDRDTPTPPISDEEAGRIGFRRMSQTPIPQVAATAAEVADTAAILDKYDTPRISMPRMPTSFDFSLPDSGPTSGAVTPEEERVPLFAHECIRPPPEGFENQMPVKPEPVKSKLSIQETAIDFDDPSLEDFPSERNAILEHVRKSLHRLPEDQTFVDGIPPSPIVGGRHHPDNIELPAPSSNVPTKERSPSLSSIPEDGEEEGYKEEILSAVPEGTNLNITTAEPHLDKANSDGEIVVQMETKPSVDFREVLETPPHHHLDTTETAPLTSQYPMDGSYTDPEPAKLSTTAFTIDSSRQLGPQEPKMKETVTSKACRHITLEPATPSSNLETSIPDPLNKPVLANTAKATAIEHANGRSQLTTRKQARSPERPLTPKSMTSAGKDARSKNFLTVFWRVVFIEWIGGFIMRLCGRDRQKA